VQHERQGLTAASRAAMKRRLCAIVLIFEGLVVFFGALATSRISDDVSSGTALGVGGGLAVACILASGLLRRSYGIAVGWAVQVLILLTGIVLPAMIAMGLLFGALWIFALRIGDMVATPLQGPPTAG
jgi:hypothetical protein